MDKPELSNTQQRLLEWSYRNPKYGKYIVNTYSVLPRTLEILHSKGYITHGEVLNGEEKLKLETAITAKIMAMNSRSNPLSEEYNNMDLAQIKADAQALIRMCDAVYETQWFLTQKAINYLNTGGQQYGTEEKDTVDGT